MLQSLCKARLGPRVEAFGDGPDGGRDAVIRGRIIWSEDDVWDGYTIMQAKFRQRLLGTDLDIKWFTEQVEGEFKNRVAYKSRGTRKLPDYLLFTTNVVLAGASGGGIEKVGALMARYASKLGGLKGWRVWHYDDIRGKLDNAPGVRAAFGLTTPGEIAAEIATRLVELQKKAAGRSDLMDGFPALTGVDTGAVSAFDRALTGVLAAHREACTLAPTFHGG